MQDCLGRDSDCPEDDGGLNALKTIENLSIELQVHHEISRRNYQSLIEELQKRDDEILVLKKQHESLEQVISGLKAKVEELVAGAAPVKRQQQQQPPMLAAHHDDVRRNRDAFHLLTNNSLPAGHQWVVVDKQVVVASAPTEWQLYQTDGYRRASSTAVSGKIGDVLDPGDNIVQIPSTREASVQLAEWREYLRSLTKEEIKEHRDACIRSLGDTSAAADVGYIPGDDDLRFQ